MAFTNNKTPSLFKSPDYSLISIALVSLMVVAISLVAITVFI